MVIKPWHITTLVCVVLLVGLGVVAVRAFRKGKRGE
jgi:hypothetical protein